MELPLSLSLSLLKSRLFPLSRHSFPFDEGFTESR